MTDDDIRNSRHTGISRRTLLRAGAVGAGALAFPTRFVRDQLAPDARTIVTTTSGRVRGRAAGPVTAFRGIPYARADRFAAPQPVKPWTGIRDALEPGPTAPQLTSPLAHVMGDFTVPQSEDCLSLNIWAPPGTGRRPVLVFLHGGGFWTGGAGLPWYDGASLAAAGDIVVVTISYRLGTLGFLSLPGVSEPNLGLRDQLAGLRWLHDNITAFGGDPSNITLSGQSAGGYSILAMMANPRAKGLFHRAILQSVPSGMPPGTAAEAKTGSELLLKHLGLGPDEGARLRTVPVADLLRAQNAVAMETARPLNAIPPFQPVADGDLVQDDPVRAAGARTDAGIQVMLGNTRDEAAAYIVGDPAVEKLTQDDLNKFATQWFGDTSHAEPRGRTVTQIVVDMCTQQLFRNPEDQLAKLLTDRGNTPWRYQFDWSPKHSEYDACHCIELPFLLGSPGAWKDAPMLGGEQPAALTGEVQRAWASFARDGNPGWSAGTVHHFK
ncbi:carboxylesterase/lipase family protein [Streptomyces sp. AV19]|uniref:carboxylesterase/lipase family protein n=1 Tax=Streptomyces sp. AV19 TaxID=2793068 RepID=UPI0018FEE3BD|nr:carboxylesterase family protein [Streptomyces sp. AV19]MBH1937293.1 carboxylesterase/lipase family protein [Streptomyces sp. AV19]MDG4536771.1 carboxylesterase family protein [Streptomyces sp. AV19]